MAQNLQDCSFKIKTFNIKYNRDISPLAKNIIQSFNLKLYYYVVEDLSYFLREKPTELDKILEILNCTVLFLHNNFFINFFDIYVYEINVKEVKNHNKLIHSNSMNLSIVNYLSIKLAYQSKKINKKFETIW